MLALVEHTRGYPFQPVNGVLLSLAAKREGLSIPAVLESLRNVPTVRQQEAAEEARKYSEKWSHIHAERAEAERRNQAALNALEAMDDSEVLLAWEAYLVELVEQGMPDTFVQRLRVRHAPRASLGLALWLSQRRAEGEVVR